MVIGKGEYRRLYLEYEMVERFHVFHVITVGNNNNTAVAKRARSSAIGLIGLWT